MLVSTSQRLKKLNSTVALLRHLSITCDHWGSPEETKAKYGILRSKAFDVRQVIRLIHDGKIEGVFLEEFQDTFDDDVLMAISLRSSRLRASGMSCFYTKMAECYVNVNNHGLDHQNSAIYSVLLLGKSQIQANMSPAQLSKIS